MSPDRAEVFMLFMKQLDIVEVMVKEEDSLSQEERKELTRHHTRIGQMIVVEGGANISMSQNEDFRVTGGDYVGGDVIKQEAGGDIKGVAAGRKASVQYSESATTNISDTAALTSSIEELANDVGRSDLSLQEKATLLPALLWWSENAVQDDAPADAQRQLSPIGSAASWVKDRITHIISSATGAIAGHWAVELVKQLV